MPKKSAPAVRQSVDRITRAYGPAFTLLGPAIQRAIVDAEVLRVAVLSQVSDAGGVVAHAHAYRSALSIAMEIDETDAARTPTQRVIDTAHDVVRCFECEDPDCGGECAVCLLTAALKDHARSRAR